MGGTETSISVKQQSVNEWIVVRNRKKAIGIYIVTATTELARDVREAETRQEADAGGGGAQKP